MIILLLYSYIYIEKGEMIISNDRYLMSETENSMYAVQMTLVLRKTQKSDFGGYKCISKNSIGDAEGTIRLYGKFTMKMIFCLMNHCLLFLIHEKMMNFLGCN